MGIYPVERMLFSSNFLLLENFKYCFLDILEHSHYFVSLFTRNFDDDK